MLSRIAGRERRARSRLFPRGHSERVAEPALELGVREVDTRRQARRDVVSPAQLFQEAKPRFSPRWREERRLRRGQLLLARERGLESPGRGRRPGTRAVYAHGRDYHSVLSQMLGGLEQRLKKLFPGLRTRQPSTPNRYRRGTSRSRRGSPGLGKTRASSRRRTDHGSSSASSSPTSRSGPARRSRVFADVHEVHRFVSYGRARGESPRLEQVHRVSHHREARRDRARVSRGDRRNLFGCDECQRVCPYNREPRESLVFGGDERNAITGMRIGDLLGLCDDDLKRLARARPWSDATRRIRRNAKVVAANGGSTRAWRRLELVDVLYDPDLRLDLEDLEYVIDELRRFMSTRSPSISRSEDTVPRSIVTPELLMNSVSDRSRRSCAAAAQERVER